MATSAILGLLPRRVVRVERWVLRDERRSAVLAASSLGEAMWEDVMVHCSISVFSGVEYCVLLARYAVIQPNYHICTTLCCLAPPQPMAWSGMV